MKPQEKKYTPARRYFLPQPSGWPLMGSVGLFLFLVGAIKILHGSVMGHYLFMGGAILVVYMLFGWFGAVISESVQGLHSKKMDRTYRWGMMWFIVSEIAFFGVFFGALFYARQFSAPMLGGVFGTDATHAILWPQFKFVWPLLKNPNPSLFPAPLDVISAWGIPALNTLILLSSAATVTWSLWGLKMGKRIHMNVGLALTILLGLIFLSCQVFEYTLAYTHYNLTLASGIYGTTFFMLTGFHAAHVTVGLLMLIVILFRCLRGDFLPEHHFAFEAASWYWHFVDVVWLFLFVFVYWL